MATNDREILRILAKHVNWQDEGDRATVAEYFDRDGTDPDAFRPFSDDEAKSHDDSVRRAADIDQGDPDDDDDDETGNPPNPTTTGPKLSQVKSVPTPATAAKPGTRR